MKRALVSIGVSSAPPLEVLNGAKDDAERIAMWATRCGYDIVKSFIDGAAGPVTAAAIYNHCEWLLRQNLDQLVIFFSGHGYAPYAGSELWLLSHWNDNPNEAINVTVSVQLARRYERPRISFIADACRVTWNDAQGTLGQAILPKPQPPSTKSFVDEFYATAFGDVSQQYQPSALRKSYGIFTNELVEALNGSAAEPRSPHWVVSSLSLKDRLRDAVPAACQQISGAVIQNPYLNSQWAKPEDVYAEYPTKPTQLPLTHLAKSSTAARAAVVEQQRIEETATRYRTVQGRERFETRTGLTVAGAAIKQVVSRIHTEIESEDGAFHLRAHGEQPYSQPAGPGSLLIQISHEKWNNCWISVPVFPGLIATALVDDDGFSSLNYRPSGQNILPHVQVEMERADDAVAAAAAMFRFGRVPTHDRIREMIDLMRSPKAYNPALAIMAAYMCHRIGEFDQIADMQQYPIGLGSYTPFDLVLLSGEAGPRPGRLMIGEFPLMSPGWGLLSTADMWIEERLVNVTRGVMPSLWTMVDEQRGEILAELVAGREAVA